MHTPVPPPLDIFLVENHEDTLFYLTKYLEMSGHRVRTARNISEALEKIPQGPVDVLISDIGLPDGEGWSLVAGLPADVKPFCIAISGYGSKADLGKSRDSGFSHHLTKPFDPEDLDRILALFPRKI